MQIRLSNVSKLVPRETLFALFSIVGDILTLEPVSLNESSEWNCVFANFSDAQRALELSRTELGDSIFYVELAFSLFLPQATRSQGNIKCRTAALFPRITFPVDEDYLRSFFLGVEQILEVPGVGAVLIEFSDRPEMLKTCGIKDDRYELVDASCCFKLSSVVKEPKLYGVPASKLLSIRSTINTIPATPLPTAPKTLNQSQNLINATPHNPRNRSPSPHYYGGDNRNRSRRRSRSRSPEAYSRHRSDRYRSSNRSPSPRSGRHRERSHRYRDR